MWVYAIILTFISTFTLINSTTLLDVLNTPSLYKSYHEIKANIEASASRHARITNSSQLIALQGFPVDEHIVNSDGYQLTMFRIPGKGPSVLLVHGLISSSDDFLTLGTKSLAIKLARGGYDVWLGNARGNIYSRRHTTLSPKEPSFWDFSWHEIGVYDLPAMIDYICNKAKVAKVMYAGHSQGTTVAFVMLSEKPEYNDKVSLVVSLSSVAWLGNSTSSIVTALAKKWKKLDVTLKSLGINELLTRSQLSFCGTSSTASFKCLTLLFYPILGSDFPQIDYKQLNDQIRHFPSGSSVKQLVHYAQNLDSNSFRKYDYGPLENLSKYGSRTPTSYKVANIKTNMLIISSQNDFPSNEKDIIRLTSKLPKKPEIYEVELRRFNHMDYVWGKNADELVYFKVIEFMKKYTIY